MEIMGIDEAGRGPLAGPVVVAGVKIRNAKAAKRLFAGIRDSKKLSAKKREEWFLFLASRPEIEYAVARVCPAVIDRINISRAANLAARRVHRKLSANNESIANKRIRFSHSQIRKDSLFADVKVLLDGGLYLPDSIPQKTIIKGDEKIPVIAAASIIAKVTRDRIMMRLHKKFPEYRFDLHKGYGTRFHRRILRSIGRSEIHRASFRF
ncbi:MAG: hypothetical protein A3A32_02805 [Candidatus Wildermuthbacteria bacterium RIFCSPLOWO2_01_FULL_48_35]|uniref:Ribonuclease n=1 Tax=Candidatus Wildermuthbacteria bacterium RIFCSPLOWO2_01_FULL_48_35 TaxID=1802463 RepID=A0A1G2RMH7_9BACT|nr:MAG: hypothetical protein A3A32_02805 [Candidatus Wildermuthbacteria bacterium RIFCSPLOWO2_01_FULL_48_35]